LVLGIVKDGAPLLGTGIVSGKLVIKRTSD